VPALYFLGTRCLGSSPLQWWSDTQLSNSSKLLVCPTCGDVWGRVVDNPSDWTPLRMGCRKHPWATSDVGGSFIYSWLQRIDALPPDVLRYELELRLKEEE